MHRRVRWRLHARDLFLTYPKCTVPPKQALRAITRTLAVDWVVVSREYHRDGSLHLHVAIHLTALQAWNRDDCFDYITGQHGNYQAARNLHHVLIYVTKAGRYVSKGINVDRWLALANAKKSTLGDSVMEMVTSGASFRDVVLAYPGYAMIHRRQIKDMIAEQMQWNYNECRSEWVCPTLAMCTNPEDSLIIGWLMDNIRESRIFKQKALWIHGEKNMGKTSFLNYLDKSLMIYWIPQEPFDNLWEDNVYDVAVCDAFHGHRTITWLEQFVQGGTQPIRTKGGQIMKRHNIPVIICSNFSIPEAYPNVSAFGHGILACRFIQVNVLSFIDFYQ